MCARPRDKRPFAILFLVPNLPVGGAERQLAELVTHMDAKRFRPIVVCQKGGGPFFDQIASAGIEAHRFEIPGRWDPRFAWRLARLCRKRQVQALVIRGFSTGVVGRLVGRFLGIRPTIMAEHSTGRIDLDPKKPPIDRLLAPLAHGVIAVARGQIPFLVEDVGFNERQIRVIYNGIDLSKWTPTARDAKILAEFSIPSDAPVVGILAGLRPEKDHATFLRAAQHVLEDLPKTHFLIVGDGTERARLLDLSRELKLGGSVHFAGNRSDVPRLLSVFDVSVLCSVTVETFPMSFLEAMAMKRPLVATPVGGVAEMIEEGENGFLVPCRDPRALADALLRVVSDPETVRRMGEKSRQIVEERFTLEQMVRDTQDYLDSFFEENTR